MAKFKPAKGGKKGQPTATARGAIPCLVVILGGMILLFFLFYSMVKSGG